MVTEAVKQSQTYKVVRIVKRGADNSGHWPLSMGEAYDRYRGPYTIENATVLIQEESLELYNGWLVWQAMTDPEERRIAANVQVILDLAVRFIEWGQSYPDQFECLMKSKDLYKPDVCLLSRQRFSTQLVATGKKQKHQLLKGAPELVIEMRSPSNTRKEDRDKRTQYFANGCLVVWDVDPKRQKIWVYEVENPKKAKEYKVGDEITCEQIIPGWRRAVADFFKLNLTAEQVVGEMATGWRAESRAEGLIEGETNALRKMVIRQARRRFGKEALPADLEARLNSYDLAQLEALDDELADISNSEEWLATFPA